MARTQKAHKSQVRMQKKEEIIKMKEWNIFVKVRSIMKKVNHPLMLEKYNKIWNEFQELKIKPSQLNNSIIAQDFLRKALSELKQQAESCLYYGYQPNKEENKSKNIIFNNGVYLLEIISLIN